jgi:hypothetical protein
MKTARDCYPETLRIARYDADIRDEMMGHAPVYLMAAHYNGVIDKERLIEINSCLVGITCQVLRAITENRSNLNRGWWVLTTFHSFE